MSSMKNYLNLIEQASQCLKNDETDRAMDLYRRAIERAPTNSEAYYQLAIFYHDTGDIENASINFQKAADYNPRDASAFNNLGVLQHAKGSIEEAASNFKKAILIDPNYTDALYGLGSIHLKQMKIYDAIATFKKCIEIAPGFKKAQKKLEECYQKTGLENVWQHYKDILIVMEEGIGNMIMLTPTIKAIKKQMPHSKITVLGKQPSIQVIDGWELIEKAITVPDNYHYDVGFFSIWSGNYKQKYGKLITSRCTEVYTIHFDNVDLHETEHHIKIAKFFGYTNKTPALFCMSREVNIPFHAGDKVAALSDTALNNNAWERKRWPYYKELSLKLIENGYTVILIGGREELNRFKQEEWHPEIINCLGKYTLQETSGLLKRCSVFIGNDSGPAHIAAAAGIPTFVFFGPTKISKNSPLGTNVKTVHSNIKCSPCQYTKRWPLCDNWLCMKDMTVEKVLPIVTGKEEAKTIDTQAVQSKKPLQLTGKNYFDCQLIEENNIKYLIRNGIKEQLRIHLVGAGKSNFPWGMENEIARALLLEGIDIIETDYRMESGNLVHRFMQEAHFMLVCKGSGIPPDLIREYPGRTLLWYQDDIFTTSHALRDLTFNGHAFDTVYSFDKSAIEEYQKYGMKDVRWLPLAMSPALHRKLFFPKKYDISFIGNIHPNRRPFLEKLRKKFNVFVKQAFVEEMVQIVNQTRIVLNLGIGRTGIQQRVFETLGCGSFLLTNEIPKDSQLFTNQNHLVYFKEDTLEELISYYLKHEDERETIAQNGYLEAHAKHTFTHRIYQLLADMVPEFQRENTKSTIHSPVIQTPKEVFVTRHRKRDFRPQRNRKRPRIFAAFRNFNWEDCNLQPALEELGDVIRFNWHPPYNQYDRLWHFGDKQNMNTQLFQRVKEVHEQEPIDVFFGYLSGRLVSPGIIRAITMMGIPTLNIALDDKTKFYGNLESTGFAGPVDIANAFSLCWTSTKDAVEKYEQAGATVIYMPPGANEKTFRPKDVIKDIDVCFVGQNNGIRPKIMQYLRGNGINIQVFGKGWESGEIPLEKLVELVSRSKITLGIGAVSGYSDVVQIKGRDFEVPMCGGFYLTQYNAELEEFFDIGREIVCYKTFDEMLDKIHHYLSHPEEALEIRQAALKRSLAEHTWVKRFQDAFHKMGVLS
ncbi:MAG: glycosyltransferase [Candidatus Brocadiaceae bacterium]|nr:glycosyltransferase [Candidatus Brocadiaceae bacterium]